MAVFTIVLDDQTGNLVALFKTDTPSVFPLGSQQFGPTPTQRILPQVANANHAIQALEIEDLQKQIRNSPLLTDAQRSEYQNLFNSLLPPDRLHFVGSALAEQQGLISARPLADTPAKRPSLVAVYVDP